MRSSEGMSEKTLREYLIRMLRASGMSMETTETILKFLYKDPEKMSAMMDWLGEHIEEDLTEEQALAEMGRLLQSGSRETVSTAI